MTSDGKLAIVSNGGDNNVLFIDTATDQVVANVPVGKRPWNMAVDAKNEKLYVANGRSNSVSVIDIPGRKPIGDIAVGEMPWGVYIAPVRVAR